MEYDSTVPETPVPEEEQLPENPNCMLSGSPYCALLHERNCSRCYVMKLDIEQQQEAAEDIFYIADALGDDGVEPIMKATDCALCIREHGSDGEEVGEADGWAVIDIAHEHPTAKEKTGGKYDRSTSMAIPVQLPVCNECRRSVELLNYLPLGLGVLIALAGLVLTWIEPIRAPLARAGKALPFLVFLIFVFLGIIVESVVKRALHIRIERTMNTRAKRIPALADLLKRGWFVIGAEDGMLPFTFIRERLPYGILTGDDQKAKLNSVRALGVEGALVLKQRWLEKQKQNGKENQ